MEGTILGVIGGMGPLATQLFYKMIIEKTKAHCDQEHINMIILNHATMPDRTDAILSCNIKQVYDNLLADAKFLEQSGASYIAVPCNTSHYIIDMIKDLVNIPFVHMMEEATDRVKKSYPGGRVGILATDGTIKTELYQKEMMKQGLTPVLVSNESQRIVMSVIYDGIKEGGTVDIEGFMRVEEELKEKGCNCALMACTELSCLKERYPLSDFYIDAMEVLAEKSILLCGKTLV